MRRGLEGELFEKFLHTRYVGQKRFSLEGGETIIPMLDKIVEETLAHELAKLPEAVQPLARAARAAGCRGGQG